MRFFELPGRGGERGEEGGVLEFYHGLVRKGTATSAEVRQFVF